MADGIEWEAQPGHGITWPQGFSAAGVRCGMKEQGNDLALIVSETPATVAGVFTTNYVQAPCVTYSKRVVRRGSARAIVCNAGNANACNGGRGDRDTRSMADLVAQTVGTDPAEVLVAQTGIIGQAMPMDKVADGLASGAALSHGPAVDEQVARAIMTTDLVPKQIALTLRTKVPSGTVRIGGVCKGSGMIAPVMAPPHATMLCFLTTDVGMPPHLLQEALNAAVERTFNRITVDGDTSTNDMVLLLANGLSGMEISDSGPAYASFRQGLESACRQLAKAVARDGEGATKLVEVVVRGASSAEGAARIARTIAESPLVKTALYGCDPNWGRILMAAGRAGVPLDPNRIEVLLGEICVCRDGHAVELDEQGAHDYLKQEDVRILIDLHGGTDEATFWTCDYSYDYIKINADYHT
jgi:glutamate N-acetyltransferase / amino-acid N-acetyltransferase